MKIINWNVGRPTKNKAKLILDKLNELDGDILILTETNSSVTPPTNFHLIATTLLPADFEKGVTYTDGKNRVSIWTKFPVTKTYKTFDNFTRVCADIATPFGSLTFYATIIGVYGGVGQRFQNDLQHQLSDFDNLFADKQVCLVGDYNIIFSDIIYPSQAARQTFNSVFKKFSLTNHTASIHNCVDHITISNDFTKDLKVNLDETWNDEKNISDHIGVSITITQ